MNLQFGIIANPVVAIRCGHASLSVNDAFVKDQAILFLSLSELDFLGNLISFEEITYWNHHDSALIQWLVQLTQNVVFHCVKIQDLLVFVIQRKTTGFKFKFPLFGPIRIIFCATTNELYNLIPSQFIRKLTQKIAQGEFVLPCFRFVNY